MQSSDRNQRNTKDQGFGFPDIPQILPVPFKTYKHNFRL